MDAGLTRDVLSGLVWALLAKRKSGPVERRLSDWRVRILGSEIPARVLSRAAAARARKPPDLWELVEAWLRCCERCAGEAGDAGDGDGLVATPEEEVGIGMVGMVLEVLEAARGGCGVAVVVVVLAGLDGDDVLENGVLRDDCVDCETAAI